MTPKAPRNKCGKSNNWLVGIRRLIVLTYVFETGLLEYDTKSP